ncbi:MAG: insulinase family protein [Deltaproteobacteria bacterium]|nr:insulinase family protein [Deltaproteobacteria bacterium]
MIAPRAMAGAAMGALLVLSRAGAAGAADVGTSTSGANMAVAETRAAQLAAAGVRGIRPIEVVPFGPGTAERWRLDNGLHAIVAADGAAGVAAVHVWVKVGSADETAGKTGLAHLLEHLMFKGTRSRPAGVYDRELEAHGASTNAATWVDWTMYHQVVPPEVVPLVVQMEADRFVHLNLTAAGVRSELAVVQNERRETVDSDPDGLVAEHLGRLVHGGGPYGHPVIGWAADLAALKRDDVMAFYRQRYVPGNAAVVVAGTFDPTAVLAEIVHSFGGIAALPPPDRPQCAHGGARLTAEVRQAVAIDARAARLAVAWPTVPRDHADAPALELLAEALCGAASARLDRLLIDDKRLASDVNCHQDDTRLPGAFDVWVTLRPGRTASEALTALDAAVAALVGPSPLTAEELDLARVRATTGLYRQLASADGRADVLGQTWAVAGSLAAHGQWWQRMAQVSPAEVAAAARRWIGAPGRAVVLADPAPPVISQRPAGRSGLRVAARMP